MPNPTTIFTSLNWTPLNALTLLPRGFTPTGAPDAGSQDTDFSDVESGSSSTAPPASGRTYTVVKGDSLSKIAKQFYGDAQQWRKIYEANSDQIKNPDLIQPGQTFRIPGA